MADSTLIWAPTRPEDGGVFYRAPLGTTLPTSATAPLNALFVDHGWVGEEGITYTMTRDTTKHHAFGGDLVKTTQDNYESTLKLTLLESDPDVLETVFGKNSVTMGVDGAGNRTIRVDHKSAPLPRSAFVVEVVEGEKIRRLVIQEGQVISVDDVVYVHDDLLSWTIEVDCYKPATGNPEAVVEYILDTGHAAGS
jgi:hypothetical protein